MPEQSPYPEENELEDEAEELMNEILASAIVGAVSAIIFSKFTPSDYSSIQNSFRDKSTQSIPTLRNISERSINNALERTLRELKLKDFDFDYSDERVLQHVRKVFNENFEYLLATNDEMFDALQRMAIEKGWSDEELARRLKRYFGLTPRYLQTVINMEDALRKEGVGRKRIESIVDKRLDDLIQSRLSLAAGIISTSIVEGSKEILYEQLAESGKINQQEYVKQWVSVIDDRTTSVCVSAHLTTAELGGTFPNGLYGPPNTLKIHPCRSSTRIIKRKLV